VALSLGLPAWTLAFWLWLCWHRSRLPTVLRSFSCPTSPPSGTCARCTSLPYRRHSVQVGGSTEVSRRRYRIRARKLVHPSTHPLSVSRVRFCWHVVLLLLLLPQRQKVLPPLRSSEVVQYLTSRADLFPRSCPCSSSSSSPLSCR